MSETRAYVMLGIAFLIALVWIGFGVWLLVDGRRVRRIVGIAAALVVMAAVATRGAKVLRAAQEPETPEPSWGRAGVSR